MAINKKRVASKMNQKDIEYCSQQYGLTVDFVRGMTDADWRDFFQCSDADLPYYLIADDRHDEVEIAELIDNLFDEYLSDEEFLEDEAKAVFGEGVRSLFDQYDRYDRYEGYDDYARPFTSTYTPTTSAKGKSTTGKSKVAVPAPAKKVVPHYFVIVK